MSRRGTRVHAAGILSANALNNFVALGVLLASAQLMPVGDFGVLGLAVAVVVIVATLTDWGLSTALVRTASRIPAQADAAGAFVRAWKLLLLLILVAFALVIPDDALTWLWPGLGDRVTLAVTLLSAGLLGCWLGRRALEQAQERFAALHRAALACAALRIVTFAAITAIDAVNPVTVLLCLYVVPLLALLGWQRRGVTNTHAQLLIAGSALLRYSGWVGVSALCFVVFTRAPLLALGSFGSAHDLGVFSGALAFTLGFSMLGEALRSVALPRIVRAADAPERAAVRAWLRRLARPVVALAAVALLLIALCYELILGAAHAGGASLLLVMGIAVLASIGLGLHNALLHALARPELEAAVNVSRLIAFAGFVHALPPTPMALATAYALVLVSGELALYAAVRFEETVAAASARRHAHADAAAIIVRRLAPYGRRLVDGAATLGKGLPAFARRLAGRALPDYHDAKP